MKQISHARFQYLTRSSELIAHNGKWRRDILQSLYLTSTGRVYLKIENNWRGQCDKYFAVELSELEGLEVAYFSGAWNREPKFNELLRAQIERKEEQIA